MRKSFFLALLALLSFFQESLYAVIRLPEIPDEEYVNFGNKSEFLPVGIIMRSERISRKNFDEETPSIIKTGKEIFFPCGTATLIEVEGRTDLNGLVILTAAHVLKQNEDNYFYLENQFYQIKKFFRPGKYVEDRDVHDIAIGVLSERILHIKPAAIFHEEAKIDDLYLQVLTTAGYGASGRGDVNAIYDEGQKRAFNHIIAPYKANIGEKEKEYHFARESLYLTNFFKPRPAEGALMVKNLATEMTTAIYDYSLENAAIRKALLRIGVSPEAILEIETRISHHKILDIKNFHSSYDIKFVPFQKPLLLGGSTLGYSGAPDFIQKKDGFYIIGINVANQEGVVKDVKYLIPAGSRGESQDYYYPSALESCNVVKMKGIRKEHFKDAHYMDKLLATYLDQPSNQTLYNAYDIHLFLPAFQGWMRRVFEKL